MNDRDLLFNEALKKLTLHSKQNIQTLKNHLYHLKVNNDFVITTPQQVYDLVSYLNGNHEA